MSRITRAPSIPCCPAFRFLPEGFRTPLDGCDCPARYPPLHVEEDSAEFFAFLDLLPGKEFTEMTDALRSLSTLNIFNLNERIADLAVKLVPEHAPKGLGGRDCVILATMKFSGTRKLVTHDGAFRRVEGIEVIDGIPQRA